MNLRNPVARLRSRDLKVLAIIKANSEVLSTPSTPCNTTASPDGHLVILSFSTNVEEWAEKMAHITGVDIDPVIGADGEKFSLR